MGIGLRMEMMFATATLMPTLCLIMIICIIGITGTDVAKASADMVLTKDNFVSIVDAIEEGRTIYANIGKFVFYLLSTNISEVRIH